jgi:hypothetical protein
MLYWSRPVNWKDHALTPNPDTIYFNPFYDTTKGPVVLEVPAVEGESSITGSIDDGSRFCARTSRTGATPTSPRQWRTGSG